MRMLLEIAKFLIYIATPIRKHQLSVKTSHEKKSLMVIVFIKHVQGPLLRTLWVISHNLSHHLIKLNTALLPT